MFAFLWILILGYFQHTNSGYVEIVEKTSCDTCKLMLTCRSLTSVIAILKVDFLQDSPDESLAGSLARGLAGNSAGNSSVASGPFPPIHPRDVLNQRCSGLNFCSFILSEDCPGSDIFGRGNITIKYACVSP
ncbi:hypothetical protein JTB14_013704 [Gonioctena quinquepunctata]|nr:hypothetical protein JTB14_013704 [Gonioctena quinquepunctata]